MTLNLLVPFVREAFDEKGKPLDTEQIIHARQFVRSFGEFVRTSPRCTSGNSNSRRSGSRPKATVHDASHTLIQEQEVCQHDGGHRL